MLYGALPRTTETEPETEPETETDTDTETENGNGNGTFNKRNYGLSTRFFRTWFLLCLSIRIPLGHMAFTLPPKNYDVHVVDKTVIYTA